MKLEAIEEWREGTGRQGRRGWGRKTVRHRMKESVHEESEIKKRRFGGSLKNNRSFPELFRVFLKLSQPMSLITDFLESVKRPKTKGVPINFTCVSKPTQKTKTMNTWSLNVCRNRYVHHPRLQCLLLLHKQRFLHPAEKENCKDFRWNCSNPIWGLACRQLSMIYACAGSLASNT